jgi:hypothetical protein
MTHPAIAVLLSIQPKPLAAANLLHRLYANAPASIDDLLAAQEEIEAAINEADVLAYRSEKAVDRCLRLQPIPASKPPTGF